MAFIPGEPAPKEALTLNGIGLVINGVPVQAIQNLGGIQRNTGNFEWVDGPLGFAFNFSDQKRVYGPVTFRYYVDPTTNEFDYMRSLVDGSIESGLLHTITMIKYHYGQKIFKIVVYNCLFNSESLAEFDKAGAGPFQVDISAPCSFIELIPLT